MDTTKLDVISLRNYSEFFATHDMPDDAKLLTNIANRLENRVIQAVSQALP
ncbi:MAG: hypothetical protein PHU86_03760 [Patescibacteria group bacterium]|nr:hypothetical protein [Patescibacteria group bacterium]